MDDDVAGWLDGCSNAAKKRLCGNAVVPLQAAAAVRLLLPRVLAALEREHAITPG